MKCITYKGGYKYQLWEDFTVETGILPLSTIDTEYIRLDTEGLLTVKQGYAWDGPSGPAIDSRNFMRASLVHDALYQLMRNGWLSPARHRRPADKLLQALCLEDGMSKIRAWWVYLGVRFGGGPSADQCHCKALVKAPAE